jgi:hypothetical protein
MAHPLSTRGAHTPPGVVVISGVEVNDNTEDVRSPNQGITESQFYKYVLRSLKVASEAWKCHHGKYFVLLNPLHLAFVRGTSSRKEIPS